MSKSNFQFRLSLPEEWDDASIFTFLGPDTHGVKHTINLTIEKNVGDHTTDSFARERIQTTQASLADAQTLKDAQKTLPNGLNAYEWIYKTVPIDGKPRFYQQIYTVINKKGYTFSAVYSKMSFKLLAGQVEQIISSFTPLEN